MAGEDQLGLERRRRLDPRADDRVIAQDQRLFATGILDKCQARMRLVELAGDQPHRLEVPLGSGGLEPGPLELSRDVLGRLAVAPAARAAPLELVIGQDQHVRPPPPLRPASPPAHTRTASPAQIEANPRATVSLRNIIGPPELRSTRAVTSRRTTTSAGTGDSVFSPQERGQCNHRTQEAADPRPLFGEKRTGRSRSGVRGPSAFHLLPGGKTVPRSE